MWGAGKRAPKDSYSLVAATRPAWGIPAKPSPAYFGFWLWNRYMGPAVSAMAHDDDSAAWVSHFDTGELGVIFVNWKDGSRTFQWGEVVSRWFQRSPACRARSVVMASQ